MSATQNFPEKPYYRVNEVCQLTDTQPYVLRFWESEFPQLSPERKAGGAAVYKKNDVELIFRIKSLLYEEEYTIAGARQVLSKERPRPARKPARKAQATPQAPAEAAQPRQLELDATLAPPSEIGISRERYEDALEEINLLRLQVSEAENRLRKAEHSHTDAIAEAESLRDKHDRAIGRLEAILQSLT